LLGPTERKNGWQLAEQAGETTPYGVQHLLGRASWDADEVRDDLREYVVEHLGDREAVLIVDETGFLKKGEGSAGVKPQYSGTAGKVENCQVGVFVCYATEHGQAFIDRELYLPEEWAEDTQRRRSVGVPDEVPFASKPRLARDMLQRALQAGVELSWVVADSVYGDARHTVGMFLEEREQPHVLAVSGKAHVWAGFRQHRVGDILEQLREGTLLYEGGEGWQRLSAGSGSKGERLYDWIRLGLSRPLQEGFRRWLLIRRDTEDPEDLTAYIVFAPEGTTLQQLAKVAGSRWPVEAAFEAAKSQTGLDEYEVRSWHGWYRHITLSLFTHALLAAIGASGQDIEYSKEPPEKGGQKEQRLSTLAEFKRGRGLCYR
jgi:SRSO17 transposase